MDMTEAGPPPGSVQSQCPSCGQPGAPGDAFCEYCGVELAPAVVSGGDPAFIPSCPVCSVDPEVTGPVAVTSDGYCESCGHKVPTGRDHVALDLGTVAGVTDRGLRHPRNEDAMALATATVAADPVAIAVVCDGVSSSPQPDEASLAGAQAAVRVLLTAVRVGDDVAEAAQDAVAAAATAMSALAGPGGAPSATYVSAVVGAHGATVCWVGDSRCYWLDASGSGSRRLTTDDSLAQEMVSSGLLDEATAMNTPQAHVITRWLGADANDPSGHVTQFSPTGPGVLLVCSDGLWNYQPEADGLAALALPAALSDPAGAADTLLKFALDAGGVDNITVVLVPYPLDAARSARS
jgi:serine/threonine protein phosphatase PrpC